MNTHIDKAQENKSNAAANNLPKRQSKSESTFQFVDNRPELVRNWMRWEYGIFDYSFLQQTRASNGILQTTLATAKQSRKPKFKYKLE